jgi:hypothetical protein
MATTTPNFGWTVPTSSDLVKNGATAIETLGDSVDASFAGLTVNAQTGTTTQQSRQMDLTLLSQWTMLQPIPFTSQQMRLYAFLLALPCLCT